MPVISFANPKGGSGKTTSVLLLACEIARTGQNVTIIDGDPNLNIQRWKEKGNPDKENITVVSGVTEESIMDEIEKASRETPFVLVDLEGTASLSVMWAVSVSDLVILPIKGSYMDIEQGMKALKLIRSQEKASRRSIPYRILFTQTSAAIRPATIKHITEMLVEGGYKTFDSQIIEREAYRAIFYYGCSVRGLQEHGFKNLTNAIGNAREFMEETFSILESSMTEWREAS